MKKRHPALVRALALMLAVVLTAGLCTVGASAATLENAAHYGTYTCLGDSIAAGFGPDNLDYVGMHKVPFAYHTLVADAVTADTFYQMARPGGGVNELRYFMEDDYEYTDGLFLVPLPEENAKALRAPFQKAVKDADLITLNVGSNDVLGYALRMTQRALNNAQDVTPEFMKDFIDRAGGLGQAIQRMFDTATELNKVTDAVNAFIRALNEGYWMFRGSWDQLCKDIYEANSDVTLVALSTFNPVKSLRLNENDLIRLGQAMDSIVMLMNEYIGFSSPYAHRYLYANVTNTETYELKAFRDPEFFQSMIGNVHPTHEGHKYMAEQIVKLLPERSEDDPQPTDQPEKAFPFTDVPESKWSYDDIYYVWENGLMNGKDDTRFDPEGTTTRAEFATVIYRMAGSPEVTKADYAKCPFTDLKAEWYMDAVVWAYHNGVVNGTSRTAFSPDRKITREQMVAMLYRFAKADEQGDLTGIKDAAAISDYAKPAVAWAVKTGVVTGYEDHTFRPQGSATREQMAAIMARYGRLNKQ